MNKLTLINVKDEFLRQGGDRPALGTLYIASHLNDHGIETNVLDLNHYDDDMLKDYLKSTPTGIFGISMTTPQYKEAHRVGEIIKQEIPYSKLICGGAHPTSIQGEMPDLWDHVIVGEGEEIMLDLMQNGFPNNKVIQGTKLSLENKVLDHVGIPDRSLLPMEKYSLTINGKKASTIMTSRGCPYVCTFCSEPILNKGFRRHSPKHVVDEMEYLKNDFGIEALIIYDDVYVLNRKRVKEISREMIKRNLDMEYRATTRAKDLINDIELLPLLKDSGCVELCLGTETGDEEVLARNDKGMSVKDNMKAIEQINKAGIKSLSYMITGLPGFSEKTEKKSLEFLKESGVDEASFYMLAPFPSTPIWVNRDKYDLTIFEDEIREDQWDITQVKADNKDVKCYIEYPHIKRDDIKNIWLENLSAWESHTMKLNKVGIQDK